MDSTTFYHNGICLDTGWPCFPRETKLPIRVPDDWDIDTFSRILPLLEKSTRGTMEGIDPASLNESGWGVIFPAECTPELLTLLTPLIEHRRKVAGPLTRIFQGKDGYQKAETTSDFLRRHGAAPGPVDPNIMPYYLLLIGSPQEIPLSFQSHLDMQYAVGRLCFETLNAYTHYAKSLIQTEGVVAHPRTHRAAFFGPSHADDPLTELSRELLVQGLATRISRKFPNLDARVYPGEAATKQILSKLWGGDLKPDLYFGAGHGIVLAHDDSRHRQLQGALVCGGWEGPGTPALPESVYSAADLPAEADLTGSILFQFSCFGAATPQFCSFESGQSIQRKQTSTQDSISLLPMKLLGHPGGACLAMVAHIDRTFATNFTQANKVYLNTFETCLTRLISGKPLGWAMEAFGLRHAELLVQLAEIREYQELFPDYRPDNANVLELIREARDTRNFVVLGDPAVALGTAR